MLKVCCTCKIVFFDVFNAVAVVFPYVYLNMYEYVCFYYDRCSRQQGVSCYKVLIHMCTSQLQFQLFVK